MLEKDFLALVDSDPDRLGGHAHFKAYCFKTHAINKPQFEHPSVG